MPLVSMQSSGPPEVQEKLKDLMRLRVKVNQELCNRLIKDFPAFLEALSNGAVLSAIDSVESPDSLRIDKHYYYTAFHLSNGRSLVLSSEEHSFGVINKVGDFDELARDFDSLSQLNLATPEISSEHHKLTAELRALKSASEDSVVIKSEREELARLLAMHGEWAMEQGLINS